MSKVFAVVHVQNQVQAAENLRVAEDTGCDGAFVISHGEVNASTLWDIYFSLRRDFKLPLGINQLGYPTFDVLADAIGRGRKEDLPVPMIWADNYKTSHQSGSCPEGVRSYQQNMRGHANREILLFGGVAFKHQPEEHLRGAELIAESVAAAHHVDVLTTSGVRTGTAPDLEKIQTMREAIGPTGKLAVASGITPENVDSFLPFVDYFLVSTGISKDFYNLDSVKTHRLTRRVKQ